jgi:membrane protein DedA with SNARE-associated domain
MIPSFFQGGELGYWAYLVIALLVAVEGPIATLVGAVAASAGYLNPFLVFLSAVVGNLSADSLWYFLGLLGKLNWLVRYGRWLGLQKNQVMRFEEIVHDKAARILFISKLTLSLMIPTLIATGLARVPMRRWFGALFAGELIWTGFLTVAGYYFGHYVQKLERGVQIFALTTGAVVLILFIRYLIHRMPDGEKSGD